MSYRIYLDDNIEIMDCTPIQNLAKVDKTSTNEYPDYVVDKKGMEMILSFYKKTLFNVAEEIKQENKQMPLMFASFVSYFKRLQNNKNYIIDSSNFFLQYFYLVKIYQDTDWEKTTLKITHG